MQPASSIRTLAQPAVKPLRRLLGCALGLAFSIHSTAGIVIDNFSEGELGVDLRADGSDAFLLTFADIYPRTVWRGLYYFSVNGDRYGLRIDPLAMNGSRMIRIPFSVFSSAPSFVVNTIQFEAARVPAGHRLVLDSIVTVNADAPPPLSFSLSAPNKLQIDWSTNVTGYIVETSPNLELGGWTPVTNSVDVVRRMFSVTVETPGALGYFRLRHE